jgi:hypothetical protein
VQLDVMTKSGECKTLCRDLAQLTGEGGEDVLQKLEEALKSSYKPTPLQKLGRLCVLLRGVLVCACVRVCVCVWWGVCVCMCVCVVCVACSDGVFVCLPSPAESAPPAVHSHA